MSMILIMNCIFLPLTVGYFFGKNHVDPNKQAGEDYYADYQPYDFI